VSAGPQSVGRVFGILDYLVSHRDGATLSELAAFCEAPKTSLVGLLNALLAEGCVAREHGGRYLLGPRVMGLAMQAVAGSELKDVAHPYLERLMQATGETTALGVLSPEGDLVVCVDRVESVRPIRYAITVGERRELHCTAMGKALLAWFPKARLDDYLAAHTLHRFTDTTITSPTILRKELRRIREDGLSRSNGERVADACGVAAPVFLAGGTVGAALLVAGPMQRMREHAAANEQSIRRLAADLTDALGGVAPTTGALA